MTQFLFILISFLKFLFYIGVLFIHNVVLVSGVQQSDSVIYIYMCVYTHIIFQIISHIDYYRIMCYTVGSCWLFYIEEHAYVNSKLLISLYPSH